MSQLDLSAANNPDYKSTEYVEPDFPKNKDGTKDYLQVDEPIPGQNFVCLSFISPEDMIKKRDLYYFNQFAYREVNKTLKDQALHMAKEVNRSLKNVFEKRIQKLKKSINSDEKAAALYVEHAYKDFQFSEEEFANKCMHLYHINYDEIQDKYSMFKTQNEADLGKQFDQENDYKCSVRGLKIRGVFDDPKRASAKCKELRELGEPVHVFVAPVGRWLPWDPEPDAVQDSDYMLPALNELMGKYHENVKQKNQFFNERKREMMQDANTSAKEKRKAQLRKKLLAKKEQKLRQAQAQKEMEKMVNNENKIAVPDEITDDWVDKTFG